MDVRNARCIVAEYVLFVVCVCQTWPYISHWATAPEDAGPFPDKDRSSARIILKVSSA